MTAERDIDRICQWWVERMGQGEARSLPPGTQLLASGLLLNMMRAVDGNLDAMPPMELHFLQFPGMLILYADVAGQAWAKHDRDKIERILGERLIGVRVVRDLGHKYGLRTLEADVPLVAYGEAYLQQWALLKDVVRATRAARRARRLHPKCVICGAQRRYVNLDLDDPFQFAFAARDLILRRFYTRQAWETRHHQSEPDHRSFYNDQDRYQFQMKHTRVCSAACEATRFARWRGRIEWETRLYWKQRNAERYETKWLTEARKQLKTVRRYLAHLGEPNHAPSPSPDAASTPARSSPSS